MEPKQQQAWLDESWQRSQGAGLLESQSPEEYRLNRAGLQHKRHLHKTLIELTQAHALPLFNQLMAHTQSRLILSDPEGFVLSHWGLDKYSDKLANVALEVGVNWKEQHKGTNAIGTALAARQAISVIGDQHFLRQHRFMSCSACPIFSPEGELLGALDISSEQERHTQQTQMLVSSLAQQVETALLCQLPNSHFRVDLAQEKSLLTSGWQGIVIADSEGRVLGSNPMAKQLLKQLKLGETLGDHFGKQWPKLKGQASIDGLHLKTSQIMRDGISTSTSHSNSKTQPLAEQPSSRSQSQAQASKTLHLGVKFHDAKLERAWQQANKVVDRNIPLLIVGETGVGKEQFVKQLHIQSQRHQKSLVAVNCAALPAELVESELFGYQAGAFTGASRSGFIGKIRQAHGGFLFLDEIGEMPLAAQGRLLRVLQEREVIPIGSNECHKVDIQVIAATHMNLEALITKGLFRQDLFYRLNGLQVNLPPLRQRQDIERILDKLHSKYRIAPQTMAKDLRLALLNYSWPGNLRELDNLMQVSCLMAEGEAVLSWEHLPEMLQGKLLDNKVDAGSFSEASQNTMLGKENELPPHDIQGSSKEALASKPTSIAQTLDAEVLASYQLYKENVSQCAKALGISRNTLYRKLRKLGLKA